MLIFTLKKEHKLQYKLFVGDRLMHSSRFLQEIQAYEYYKNFISSWSSAVLSLVNFNNVNKSEKDIF